MFLSSDLLPRFLAEEPRLVAAVQRLATAIAAEPRANDHPGSQPRAFLVGGSVRDLCLHQHIKDADVEVYGLPAERLERLLERLFPGQTINAGRSFGVLKLPLGAGFDIDVALPRRESKQGSGHQGFLIDSDPWMTAEEAANRRDFTINAMSLDPLNGDFVDPYHGLADLKEGIIRVTDPERFQDDPLRVYRAIQFLARLQFQVEPASHALMRQMVARGDLETLSRERITEELKKLFLRAARPSLGLAYARELDIIQRDYPELDALIRTPQEPEWHPEGNVWIHTLMVVDQAAAISRRTDLDFNDAQRLQVLLGALCHDVGKAVTTAVSDKAGQPRIRSLGHETAGVAITKTLCRRWTFGGDVVHAAVIAAAEHLKPGNLWRDKQAGKINDSQYANAVRKILKRIHPLAWRVFLAICEADHRGRALAEAATEDDLIGQAFAAAVAAEQLDQAPMQPLLQGRDLLARGLPAGPAMGRLIKAIETARDEGIIKTRAEAFAYLETLLKEK